MTWASCHAAIWCFQRRSVRPRFRAARGLEDRCRVVKRTLAWDRSDYRDCEPTPWRANFYLHHPRRTEEPRSLGDPPLLPYRPLLSPLERMARNRPGNAASISEVRSTLRRWPPWRWVAMMPASRRILKWWLSVFLATRVSNRPHAIAVSDSLSCRTRSRRTGSARACRTAVTSREAGGWGIDVIVPLILYPVFDDYRTRGIVVP